MGEGTVTACLLVIGNEILSGKTQDRNLAYLAKRLNDCGVRLTEARVIPDDEAVIIETLNSVRERFDYVFTTGGIGPTHDDITSATVAKAFGLSHGIHAEARQILEDHYPAGDLNEARLRMAMTPVGARLIANSISAAPGFQVENVFVLAGVPSVMQAMLEDVCGRLEGGRPRRTRTAKAFVPEGQVAAGLGRLQDDYPELEIGSYPFHEADRYGARLVLSGTDPAAMVSAAASLAALLDTLDAADWHWEEAREEVGSQ